jgi:hypothetical protein
MNEHYADPHADPHADHLAHHPAHHPALRPPSPLAHDPFPGETWFPRLQGEPLRCRDKADGTPENGTISLSILLVLRAVQLEQASQIGITNKRSSTGVPNVTVGSSNVKRSR